jgi:hypothetical protein
MIEFDDDFMPMNTFTGMDPHTGSNLLINTCTGMYPQTESGLMMHNTSMSNMSTNKNFTEFRLMDNILVLCGYSGFDDYETMVTMKTLKKNNKDNVLLEKINTILTTYNFDRLESIDEVFTFIRNKLVDLNVPYIMVHKNNGNYLQLVKKNVSVNDYLRDKKPQGLTNVVKEVLQYENYDDFVEKNNKIYRSIPTENGRYTDTHILTKLAIHSRPKNGANGLIQKQIIKNVFDKNSQNTFIYESDGKYYIKYQLNTFYDVVKNISCQLIDNGIILNELNHIITIDNDNKIIENEYDLIIVGIIYTKYNINIEISHDIYDIIIKHDSDYSVSIEFDGIVYDYDARISLNHLKNLKYGRRTDTYVIILNEIKYLPIEYVLFNIGNSLTLNHGNYSDIKYVNNKNELVDKKVKFTTPNIYNDIRGEREINNDDVISVGDFVSINIKLQRKYKLSYKYNSIEYFFNPMNVAVTPMKKVKEFIKNKKNNAQMMDAFEQAFYETFDPSNIEKYKQRKLSTEQFKKQIGVESIEKFIEILNDKSKEDDEKEDSKKVKSKKVKSKESDSKKVDYKKSKEKVDIKIIKEKKLKK